MYACMVLVWDLDLLNVILLCDTCDLNLWCIYIYISNDFWGQGPLYDGKPIAAFLEFTNQEDFSEAQLGLRGYEFAGYTAKKLLCRPAGPRPPKRDDGYNRRGPQGLQNVTAKASVMEKAASSVLPPPPPPVPPVVPPRPLPVHPDLTALPLPKFLPAAPPPPPAYGPSSTFYRVVPNHPYYKPKASTRYPWKESDRATWVDLTYFFLVIILMFLKRFLENTVLCVVEQFLKKGSYVLVTFHFLKNSCVLVTLCNAMLCSDFFGQQPFVQCDAAT